MVFDSTSTNSLSFFTQKQQKIPLDGKLVSHRKLDRHHSIVLKLKDMLLMKAWKEYEAAKLSKVRYTPYQFLKKIQEIVN